MTQLLLSLVLLGSAGALRIRTDDAGPHDISAHQTEEGQRIHQLATQFMAVGEGMMKFSKDKAIVIRESLETAIESSMQNMVPNTGMNLARIRREQKVGMVWIHGAGFTGWHPMMNEQLKVGSLEMRFPRAPVAKVDAWGRLGMQLSGASWYNMNKLPLDVDSNPPLYDCSIDDVHANLHLVTEAIDDLVKSGVHPERIVVAGMSQGGYMALLAATQYPKKLAGAFVYAGMLMEPDKIGEEAHVANKDLPIQWLHGTNDDVLFPSLQMAGIEALTTAGFNVQSTECDAFHTAHPALFTNLADFITDRAN